MRVIYMSPHLDDAVLSAGGLIQKQTNEGVSVEIWSFMAGVPEGQELSDFARTMHGIWGLGTAAEAVAARRAEDRAACAKLGATAVHFEFLDCIYRRGRLGEPIYSDVAVPVASADRDLAAQIAQTMIAWLRADDVVVCQLAIGSHVDHTIVRRAAEMLTRSLQYVADVPYVLDHPDELVTATHGMRESFRPISQKELDQWFAAIECYASQIGAVFGGAEQMRRRMHEHWNSRRGLSLWTPDSA